LAAAKRKRKKVIKPASATFRYYVATSADGFIADENGGFDWLHDYLDVDYGMAQFMKSVDTIVMGRKTYEPTLKHEGGASSPGKRCVVLSYTIKSGPPGYEFWAGPVEDLAKQLVEQGSRNIWIMGGGVTASAFLEAGFPDEVEQYVMPRFLGRGIPMFAPLSRHALLELAESKTFKNGAVMLRYRVRK
jgi:dihydrofolate reductase